MLAAAIITAVATVVLAWVAVEQIKASRVEMRGARAHADAGIAIAKEQAAAALAVADETRQAAERQWQPRVFVHGWGPYPRQGDGNDAAPDEMAVAYYLSNEGTGPAFNVEHGIEVAGQPYTWGDRQWRSMRAGEFIPQLDHNATQPVPSSAIFVGVPVAAWSDDLTYWSRFENLLEERFEVRNYADAARPSEFRRLS